MTPRAESCRRGRCGMAVTVRRAVCRRVALRLPRICLVARGRLASSDVSVRYIAASGQGDDVAKRSGVLELAVLGLLHESPLHGYELRKRLSALFGPVRRISFGSLYPCLKDLVREGLIAEDESASVAGVGKRGRTVYKLTAEGKERLQEQLGDHGPAAWEDESFGVRLALFSQTDADVRLKILEGRRTRLEERREGVTSALSRTREALDRYTLELQQHGLESVEREVRWLNELTATARGGVVAARPRSTPTQEQ